MLKFILLTVVVLILDQGSKYLVRTHMELWQSIDVLGRFFSITYIENPGAAFGIFANQTIFFVLLTFVILVVILLFYRKINAKNPRTGVALAVITGGAIGNLIDRMVKGTVTDMFNFHFWPIFNVADIALVLGLLYVGYRLIRNGEEF